MESVSSEMDSAKSHLYLRQHLDNLLERVLRTIPHSQKLEKQLEITNQLVETLIEAAPTVVGPEDKATMQLLEALIRRSVLPGLQSPQHPGIPLSHSALLVNARGEHRIGHEIKTEIQSADRIDLLCSFIKWSELRLLRKPLQEFIDRGGVLR